MSSTSQVSPAENASTDRRATARAMLNKVPEVTLYFWIIKVLCTTVGETAADYLNDTLGLGLTRTTWITAAVLVVALIFQFRLRLYVPGIYWFAVVLISVVGTLITDNLTDNFGVSLVTTTIVFSVVLAGVFAGWYASERTLSIHTIVTTKREAFYWLTVLFTFALGTAAGDLTAERLAVGYWKSALLFAALIGAVFALHRLLGLNAILAFWIAYILTRPLGASIGDYLSQPKADGGLGLGTTVTSIIFLLTILLVVVYLTVTKADRIEGRDLTDSVGPSTSPATPRVLVVTDKVTATPELVNAVRERASTGIAGFYLLVASPSHEAFDRASHDTHDGKEILSATLPQLEHAAGSSMGWRVAASPNAYDDIVAELDAGSYDEIILETRPSNLEHHLHVDLAQRVAQLGYPVVTVAG